METLITRLRSDHQQIMSISDRLDAEVSVALAGGEVNVAKVLDCFEYLENYPEIFHHPIEDVALGLLLSKGLAAELSLSLRCIFSQHQLLSEKVSVLSQQLGAMANNENINLIVLFSSIRQYVILQREHIQLEEDLLLPAMEVQLQPEDLKKLELLVFLRWQTVGISSADSCEFAELYRSIVC